MISPPASQSFGPPRCAKHRRDKQHGTDAGPHRSFGESHIHRPHDGPQQAHHKTVGPEQNGRPQQIFDRQGADSQQITMIRMRNSICQIIRHPFPGFFQGFRPARTPASTMAWVAVGLVIKTKTTNQTDFQGRQQRSQRKWRHTSARAPMVVTKTEGIQFSGRMQPGIKIRENAEFPRSRR